MRARIPSRSPLQYCSVFSRCAWFLLTALAVVSCQTASLYLADAGHAASNGDYRKAVELSTQAITADSSSFDSWNARGFWHTRLGNYAQAVSDLTTAIALQPLRTTAYNNRITAWLGLQQPDSAIADYTTLLAINPYNLNAQMARAQLYSQTNKHQKAIEDYEVVLAFDPYYYWAYNGRAITHWHLQHYTEAIGDYNQAVNTVLQLVQDLNNTGINRYWQPQWKAGTRQHVKDAARQRAVATYEKHLSQLLASRASIYADIDSIGKAIEDCKTALAWDSTNAIAYGNMGWGYYKKNDFHACVRLSELAVRHDGRTLYARFNRAIALLRLGNIQEAQEAYSETIDYGAFLLHEGNYADSADSTSDYLPPSLAASIERAREGAIDDLHDLVRKNIQTKEARAILREIFHLELQDMP